MTEEKYVPPKEPIWPLGEGDTIEAWQKRCFEAHKESEAFTKFYEEQKRLHRQGKVLRAERQRDLKAERQRRIKERRIERLKKARSKNPKLDVTYGGSVKGFKKTAEVDKLIKADLGSKEDKTGSYSDGAVGRIVDTVLNLAPEDANLEAKSLKGLVFSRRAVISAAARKAIETPAPEVEVEA